MPSPIASPPIYHPRAEDPETGRYVLGNRAQPAVASSTLTYFAGLDLWEFW